MTLRLFAHPLSSYSQKALIALYELALPFEFELLHSGNPAAYAELMRLWPIGKFPLLVDGDTVIPEATLIVEHLDALAGGGRLVPAEPEARREVRLLDRVFDNYIATPQQRVVFDLAREPDRRDRHGVEEAHAQIEKSYGWLEERLAGRAWAAGDAFTLADCGAAPMLFYADWFQPIGARFPTVASYLARLRRRPSVERAVEEARPYRHLVPGGVPAHVE